MNDDLQTLTSEVQPAPKRTRRTKAEMAQARASNAAEYKELKKVEGETKRQLFVRVANRRVKTAIKTIRILANMGGRNAAAYEYNQDDVDKIAATLSREITALEVRLANPTQTDIEFDLAAPEAEEGRGNDG